VELPPPLLQHQTHLQPDKAGLKSKQKRSCSPKQI
jgi:hypothetical protein